MNYKNPIFKFLLHDCRTRADVYHRHGKGGDHSIGLILEVSEINDLAGRWNCINCGRNFTSGEIKLSYFAATTKRIFGRIDGD